MTRCAVIFQPEAIAQLRTLEDYIAENASPAIGLRYVESIFDHCQALADFPQRGTMRDDVRPGLRTLSYRGRTLIIFVVGEERVDILGIFYGGQNWQDAFLD